MKKVLFTLALVVAALSVAAQEQEIEPKPSNADFVTNRFWDNWEVSAGVGAQSWFFGGNQDMGKRGKRISPEVDLSVAKWITPVFGARLQGQGLSVKSSLQGYKSNFFDEINQQTGLNIHQSTWSYYFIHADAMVNLSNWFCGYKEMRVWQPVVFAGLGYARSHISGADIYRGNNEFAFSCGLLSKFRVSKAIDLNLELKTMLVRETFGLRGGDEQGVIDGFGRFGFLPSASVGFTYRFNRRGFNRPQKCLEPDYSAYNKRIQNLENELANANATADQLALQLKNAKAPVIYKGTEIPVEMIVFFDLNKTDITPKAAIQLDYLAKMIKASDKSFMLIGLASEEGTTKINNALSENRAKAVKQALIDRGVAADKLSIEWKGASTQFKGLPQNRAVIITEK